MVFFSQVAYSNDSTEIINQLASYPGNWTALTDASLQDPNPFPGEVFSRYFNNGVGFSSFSIFPEFHVFFRSGNAEALVAVNQAQDSMVIAFRGTDSAFDLIQDGVAINTHYGEFAPLIRAVDFYLSQHHNINNVFVTGHSL